MSRDQATAGSEVPPVVEALKPGDILLFSARPGGGVTHVGMYVGEQKFIHSSNNGVKLSRLEVHDPEGTCGLTRWVGARRVREGTQRGVFASWRHAAPSPPAAPRASPPPCAAIKALASAGAPS